MAAPFSTRAALLLCAILAASCRQGPGFHGGAPIAVAMLRDSAFGVVSANSGWGMVESAAIDDGGEAVSRPGYPTGGWYPVTLPATVLGGLVAAGAETDLYHGHNLSSVDAARFSGSWWYRLEFVAPQSFSGQHVALHLDRVNYRANVWLNGKLLAGAAQIAGAFRAHELDVSAAVLPGQPNALAVEVFPPDLARDLARSWIDWNPAAPDSNMGILGGAFFALSGGVSLRFAQVASSLDLPSLARAALTVRAQLASNEDVPVTATVSGTIGSVAFSQEVALAPREVREVVFEPAAFPQLVLAQPRVWWPVQMGAQELYRLSLAASVGGGEPSRAGLQFGIRTVTSELTDSGALRFRVNGKPVFIRGAGWSPDLFLQQNPARLAAELGYVAHLGLNAVRLEGHLESDAFFELCDRLGILVLAGWQCCDAWQDWAHWGAEQTEIARGSMVDEARRLGSHPSVIDFLVGSDEAPPPDVERMFVDALQEARWPDPVSPSAGASETPLLGKSGLKMTGPYQWVAPSYWYLPQSPGGAFGFNSETGPGAAIPKLPALRKMLEPAELDALWSDGQVAQFHAGGGAYADLSAFDDALRARYGVPASVEDYVLEAQLMQYEAERALFEAFGRNSAQDATGIIHWKLNSAWPSLIWNLYDADLVPAGAYFGVKKANEPVHIQYSYDDRSVVVVNRTLRALPGLQAKAALYGLDGKLQFSAQAAVDAAAGDVLRILAVPEVASLTAFLKLSLEDPAGHVLSDNFYWLSAAPESIDAASARWYAPQTAAYADFTSLRDLPLTTVAASGTDERSAGRGLAQIQVTNQSATLALFLQFELARGEKGAEVAPALWDDNDISLLPGETRTLSVSYDPADLGSARPAVRVSGFNVPPASFRLQRIH